MSERPRFWSKQSAIACAQLVGLAALFVGLIAVWALTSPSRLPSDVRTLAEFEKRMPVPERVWLRTVEGREIFVVVGREDPVSLNSGPPVYFFDRHGQFISWSHDIGDDATEFELNAYHAHEEEALLTLAQAVDIAGRANETAR